MAGSSVKIVFDGLPALSGIVRTNAARIVAATALEVETDAKQRAPVDTGTLRRSIHTERPTPLSAVVGTDVVYAAVQEYGGGHAPAHPYMTPAAEAARPRFVAAMTKLLD